MDLEAFRELTKKGFVSTECTYWAMFSNGEVMAHKNKVCYINLICKKEPVEELWVFHKSFKNRIPFVNYILNSAMFGCVFHTKDAEEGYETGFEVNTNQPSNLILAALISLRSAFENVLINQNFLELRKMGYDDDEAFYFGSLLGKKIGDTSMPFVEGAVYMHGLQLRRSSTLASIRAGLKGQLNRNLSIEGNMRKPFGPSEAFGGEHNNWVEVFKKHSQAYRKEGAFFSSRYITNSKESVVELIALYKKEYDVG